MRPREAFERVRRADPVDVATLADSVDPMKAAESCERIMAQPYHAERPRSRSERAVATWHRAALLPGAIVLAAVLLSAAVWFTFGPRDDGRSPEAGPVAGAGATTLGPVTTAGPDVTPGPGERAAQPPRDASLLAQAADAEVIVWGEVVAVEPPRWTPIGSDVGGGSLSRSGPGLEYSTYVISPHEVWKGDISAGAPTDFLVVAGVTSEGGGPPAGGAALPRLHMGDQVVVLAARKPQYGSATAAEFWFLHGGRSVFRADEGGVFQRLDPVADDPAGNLGPLSWLRGLLQNRE